MKCIILAGGQGDSLWPLSRRTYPKQFFQIEKNHSLFQEAIARNLQYCDSFLVCTSYQYRYIVESQMQIFQGVTYRCIYEEELCKPAAAVTLACMDLPLSELVMVVHSDQMLNSQMVDQEKGHSYQSAVTEARQMASIGKIVLFGVPVEQPELRYGWIKHEGRNVVRFLARPEQNDIEPGILHHTGMVLFENGIFQQHLKRYAPSFFSECLSVWSGQKNIGADRLYTSDAVQKLQKCFLEELLFEKMTDLQVITCGYAWSDVGRLEDLAQIGQALNNKSLFYRSDGSSVINQNGNQIVVLNHADDLLVVNTQDAVYIGKQGHSAELKNIISSNPGIIPYAEKGTISYRSWGWYQQLSEEKTYRIRRVALFPGKTIYSHSHTRRSENWTIVQGRVMVTLDGHTEIYEPTSNIDIPIGVIHQISNVGLEEAVFVETACGQIIHEELDMMSKPTDDLSEQQLGIYTEAVIRLSPSFKDYLWGGTKLRDVYGKRCDYDKIAESWELSAHPAGQCVVDSGRHKGMLFSKYLKTVGADALGWKCRSMSLFPLLIKFIDARENLSVQVHPDDDYALAWEKECGKSEMWYILDREPGATLYIGFNRKVTREEVAERIRNNTILEVLNCVPTEPGDMFFIPAGTVHAIGAGNQICEIQQSSNSTYRLYDYDRRDKYGNLRELCLDKALDVLDYGVYEAERWNGEETVGGTEISCKYFAAQIIDVHGCHNMRMDESSFRAVVCLSGAGYIRCGETTLSARIGESFFIGAGSSVVSFEGEMKIMISYV